MTIADRAWACPVSEVARMSVAHPSVVPRSATRRKNGREEARKNGNGNGLDSTRRKNGKRANGSALDADEGLDKRDLLAVLSAFKRGDFSARMSVGLTGIDGR